MVINSDKDTKKLANIEQQFIELIAENMCAYGLPGTVGRVLGIIAMNQEPMTLNDLAETTGMSKTRMSQVVRKLVDYDIAYKIYKKGIRKDLYDVEHDHYQIFISLFSSTWQKAITKYRRFGHKIYRELQDLQSNEQTNEKETAKIEELLQEIRNWLNFNEWLQQLIIFMDSGEVFQYVPIQKQNLVRTQE